MLNTNRPRATVIGLMCGTSVDSIDAALCDLSLGDDGRISAALRGFHEEPVDPALRGRIFELFADPTGSLALVCTLNFEIGAAFGAAALEVMAKAGVSGDDVDAIASHGQTVWHIPPHAARPGHSVPSTLQVGEASVIAEMTGLPVVCDFRVADMAAGGNGAPLVPFADFHLFGRPGRTIVAQNIGGIANCTVLPASGAMEDVTAFDSGPGNMVIDALAERLFGEPFDRDGRIAARGQVIGPLLNEWMALPYITMPPPKTTGRELFGARFAGEWAARHADAAPEDLIATATAFTARSLVRNLADHVAPRHPIDEVLLAGGGALNPTLTAMIGEELSAAFRGNPPRLGYLDANGIPAKARECVAFALLGFARLIGLPANVPAATGARHPALLGKLVAPPPRV